MAKRRKQDVPTPPKARRKQFRPQFEFKVRCCGALHTVKMVKGRLVLADHYDRAKAQAMVVQAALTKTEIRCYNVRQAWRVSALQITHEVKRVAERRQEFSRARRAIFNSIRDAYKDRDQKGQLYHRRNNFARRAFADCKYHLRAYYNTELEVTFHTGPQLALIKATAAYGRNGATKPYAIIQLAYGWHKEFEANKMAVLDGHLILKVIEKLDVGYRVLALRLIDSKFIKRPDKGAPEDPPNWRLALSEPADYLHHAKVIPVLAEAIAYPKRGGLSYTLVWTVWKKPITAQENNY